MGSKFKVGDKVFVDNFVGKITDIGECLTATLDGPMRYYRYEVTFDSGHLVEWFDENELELYVEKSCGPSNNIIQNSATRPCYYLEEKAVFHRWVDETKMIVKFDSVLKPETMKSEKEIYLREGVLPGLTDAIPLTTTLALIELKDGSMKKVPPEEIRFITKR